MNRANDALLLLARLLMAALFLPSGIAKAMNFAPFAESLAEKACPTPRCGPMRPWLPKSSGRSR